MVFAVNAACMESPDAIDQSIVESIYKSPWAAGNPILQKIKDKKASHTYCETNSAGEVVTRGFWINNPFDTKPPENYYVFQHDMGVSYRQADKQFWNPAVWGYEANTMLVERYELYQQFSTRAERLWFRVLSLSIGIIDKTTQLSQPKILLTNYSDAKRIVFERLKKDKNGKTVTENLLPTKPENEEYTRISHVVHILEESFDQPTKTTSSSTQSEIVEP